MATDRPIPEGKYLETASGPLDYTAEFYVRQFDEFLLQRAKHVRLVVANRCGHWYMIEEREDFNRQCLALLAD